MKTSHRLLLCTLAVVGWMTSVTAARAADDGAAKPSQEDLKKQFEATKVKAESGDPRAQYSLAGCYAKGTWVETNNSEAVAWFILATDKIPLASLARVEVEKKMSAEEIRAGWLRAKALRATIEATVKAAPK